MRVPDVGDVRVTRGVAPCDVEILRAAIAQPVVQVGVVPAVLLQALVVHVNLTQGVHARHDAPVDVNLVLILGAAVVAVPEDLAIVRVVLERVELQQAALDVGVAVNL